jgi:hypothetical protein
MRIQAYTTYTGVLAITVATPRPEGVPSTRFTAAPIHEDYCAQVRALLKEHKHIDTSSLAYPAAKRLSTYFPAFEGAPIFALRQLIPAGSPRDIDPEFLLEIMRIRYEFLINLLPGAFLTDEVDAEAIERHVEYAVKRLFQVNGVPDVFIPGDTAARPGDRTDIDIVVELGGARDRTGVEIPTPAAA